MHVVVTAGPTIEPLDEVRRLTNFSTGRLGTELATYFSQGAHRVTLLLSRQAVYRSVPEGVHVVPFTTTASLREGLTGAASADVDAVFHAAAVCDFAFGEVWRLDAQGERCAVEGGKIPTCSGKLLAELVPTPKLIAGLRQLFPNSWIAGWKYEVNGDRESAVAAARQQVRQYRTNACVANGPAYGEGFGLLLQDNQHLHVRDAGALFSEFLRVLTTG